METDEYGLWQWMRDLTAQGGILVGMQCIKEGEATIVYKKFPNQKRADKLRFYDVAANELHAARLMVVEWDRAMKEGSARIERELSEPEAWPTPPSSP